MPFGDERGHGFNQIVHMDRCLAMAAIARKYMADHLTFVNAGDLLRECREMT